MKYLSIEKINKKIIFLLFLVILFPIFTTEAVGVNSSLPNFGADGLKTGLIGYWTFDGPNMKINVADSSNNSSPGFLINFSATSTVLGVGKMGQSLRFDGINDYVSVSAVKALGTSGTFCGWVNPNTSTVQQAILTSAGITDATHELRFSLNSISGSLYPIILSNNGNATADWVRTTNSVPANSWSHVCATGNGTTYQLFINGIKETLVIGLGSNTGKWFSAISGRANYKIGLLTRSTGDVIPFNGRIDDLRVYDRVLSNLEIRQIYNLGNSRFNKPLPNFGGDSLKIGLVGHWTFDGANMKNNVTDSSGNSNKGNLTNFTSTSTSVKAGKVGQALQFDGVDDVVKIPPSSSVNDLPSLTISFWAKPESLGVSRTNVAKADNASGGHGWRVGSGPVTSSMFSFSVPGFTGGDLLTSSGSGAFVAGQWAHYVATWDGTAQARGVHLYKNGIELAATYVDAGTATLQSDSLRNIVLGRESGIGDNFFKGIMDDVRLYNRVLSVTEIKQIYNLSNSKFNKALPNFGGDSLNTDLVGYWTFDGANMKSNVADVSGNSNNGSMTNFAATSTVVTFGKLGQALKFDGVDDRVVINDTTALEGSSQATWSFWLKPDNVLSERVLLAKWNSDSSETSFLVTTGNGSGSKIQMYMSAASIAGTLSSSVLSVGKWTHVVIVYDGSQATNATKLIMYVDGVAKSLSFNGTIPSTIPATTSNFNIGGFSDGGVTVGYTKGALDDVRIYNRILNSTEIKQLYNTGS